MGMLTRMGYAALDSLVEERGHEWIHRELMDRLVEGDRLKDIAAEFGVPVVVLKGWIEKHCAEDIALASRARADDLEWKATNTVESAEPETVALARLQSEHYMKVAAKLDKGRWGEKEVYGGGFSGGITIVIGDVKPREVVVESIEGSVVEGGVV